MRIKKMNQLKPGDIVLLHGYDHYDFAENDPDGYWSDVGLVLKRVELDLNDEFAKQAEEDDTYVWAVQLNARTGTSAKFVVLTNNEHGYPVPAAVDKVSRYCKMEDEPGEEPMVDWLQRYVDEFPGLENCREIVLETEEDVCYGDVGDNNV